MVKVFGIVCGRTGLSQRDADAAGLAARTVAWQGADRKAYYPGALDLQLRLTAERQSGRLLGAQIIGPLGAEVAKRLDVLAGALVCGLSVDDLADLDLSYTPPLSTPWDAVQLAAQSWRRCQAAGAD